MVDGRYHLTQAADADLERLYEWGIDRFGVQVADEYYEGLIARLGQTRGHSAAMARGRSYPRWLSPLGVCRAFHLLPGRGQWRFDRACSRAPKSAIQSSE